MQNLMCYVLFILSVARFCAPFWGSHRNFAHKTCGVEVYEFKKRALFLHCSIILVEIGNSFDAFVIVKQAVVLVRGVDIVGI